MVLPAAMAKAKARIYQDESLPERLQGIAANEGVVCPAGASI